VAHAANASAIENARTSDVDVGNAADVNVLSKG
jgi:hypothetical protein